MFLVGPPLTLFQSVSFVMEEYWQSYVVSILATLGVLNVTSAIIGTYSLGACTFVKGEVMAPVTLIIGGMCTIAIVVIKIFQNPKSGITEVSVLPQILDILLTLLNDFAILVSVFFIFETRSEMPEDDPKFCQFAYIYALTIICISLVYFAISWMAFTFYAFRGIRRG